MIDKNSLKKLGEVARDLLGDKMTIELVKWASFGINRADKMREYLVEHGTVTRPDINRKMAEIVAEETLHENEG